MAPVGIKSSIHANNLFDQNKLRMNKKNFSANSIFVITLEQTNLSMPVKPIKHMNPLNNDLSYITVTIASSIIDHTASLQQTEKNMVITKRDLLQ